MANANQNQQVSAVEILRRYTTPTPSPTPPEDTLFSAGIINAVKYWWEQNAQVGLPVDWSWKWLAEQTYDDVLYRGSLSLRLAKFYRINVGKKPPLGFQEKIGNIVGPERAMSPYLLSFTSDLFWRAGMFGDGNSCFRYNDDVSKTVMQDNGYWGTNVWCGSATKPVGKGRTWVAPNVPFFGAFTTFNAYGVPHPSIAMLISQVTGLQSKAVGIGNWGWDVYLNGDAFAFWQGDGAAQPGDEVHLNLDGPYNDDGDDDDNDDPDWDEGHE